MDILRLAVKLDKVFVQRRVMMNKKIINESGLYLGQFPILKYLSQHEGCTQKEIADWLGVSAASIALSTKRLQKAGFIKKEVDSDNMRRNILSLTEQGNDTMRRCHDTMVEFESMMFGGIPEEQLQLFDDILTKFSENITGGEGLEVNYVPLREMDDMIMDELRGNDRSYLTID
jgi:DNA-binding MarR family transcriptional regulator